MTATGRAWRALAACVGYSPDLWFPEMGKRGSARDASRAEALALCRRCPVRRPCLAFALQVPAKYDTVGIFGGKTADERRALRRRGRPSKTPADRDFLWTGGDPSERAQRGHVSAR
jgi:WhiB family redox-sensing transcriptional regulator